MALFSSPSNDPFDTNKFEKTFTEFIESDKFNDLVHWVTRVAKIIAKVLRNDAGDDIKEESKRTQRNNQYQMVARNVIYYLMYKMTYNKESEFFNENDRTKLIKRPHFNAANTHYTAEMMNTYNTYMNTLVALMYNQFSSHLREYYAPKFEHAANVANNANETETVAAATPASDIVVLVECDVYNDEEDMDNGDDDEFENSISGLYSERGSVLPIIDSGTVDALNCSDSNSTTWKSDNDETKKRKCTFDTVFDNTPLSTTENSYKILRKIYLNILTELPHSSVLNHLSEIISRKFTFRAALEILQEMSKKIAKVAVAEYEVPFFLMEINDLLKNKCLKESAENLLTRAIKMENRECVYNLVANPQNDCIPMDIKLFRKNARFIKSVYGYSSLKPLSITAHTYKINDVTYDYLKFIRDGESEIFDVRLVNKTQLDGLSWRERLNRMPDSHCPPGYVKITPFKINLINIWTNKIRTDTNTTYLYMKTSALGNGTFFVSIGNRVENKSSRAQPILNKRHKKLNRSQLYDNEVELMELCGGEYKRDENNPYRGDGCVINHHHIRSNINHQLHTSDPSTFNSEYTYSANMLTEPANTSILAYGLGTSAKTTYSGVDCEVYDDSKYNDHDVAPMSVVSVNCTDYEYVKDEWSMATKT